MVDKIDHQEEILIKLFKEKENVMITNEGIAL